MTRRLVLATRNEHKVHELRQILSGLADELGLDVVGADDVEGAPDVAETEVTFLGNARLKAVALASATGLPAVADDSGLAVEVQGTAEGAGAAFDRTVLGDLLDLATTGCEQLSRLQQEALAAPVRERLA